MEPAPETGQRLALLVATSVYSDPELRQLRAPGHDADQLAEVLRDPRIGGFDVQVLINPVLGEVQEGIEDFCTDRHLDDQLMIYLSCHGVLDGNGRLYYAATNTRRQRLAATAVAATWLNERLEDCRARRQILALDCCHSGAFAKGAKGEPDLALQHRFEPHGRGRVVLTASRSTEYSFEGDQASGEGLPSVFTHAIVNGLRTGDADRDKDGLITVTDLYQYVYDTVRAAEPRQTPELWTYGGEGNLLVAHSVRGAVIEPEPLPEDLRLTLESPRRRVRETGVAELADLLDAAGPGLALAARQALEPIAEEDHPQVAALARIAVDAPAGAAADQVRRELNERAQRYEAARQEAARQEAQERARQEAEEKARARNEADGQAPQRAVRRAPQKEIKIFINYRHEDMPFAAMTLYRELRGRFGAENIFFDEGTLRPGMRFSEEIRSYLTDGSGAFIAMIGSRWMATMTAHYQRGDLDYVAKEIELALQNSWTVIPVLVDDASLPDPSQLPPAIRALPDCEAVRLRQMNLDDDVEDLSARLSKISEGRRDEFEPPSRVLAEAPPLPGPLPALVADDEHYQMVFDEADNLVIFLGAEVNADEREGPFREGAAMLPDDTDLAEYLAAKIRLQPGQRNLAEVAQYIRMIRGEPNVFRWVKQVVGVDSEPGPVHKYLARFPKRLEELGLQKRYPMIVTPKLDLALERAFREEDEPFDVALYMAPGTQYAGRFVHLPWGSDPRAVIVPNEYTEFPIVTDYGELTRTVIVRTNGAVDDLELGYRWKSNFVITEDHYIDYLGGRPAEEVVPGQILAKLRQASCLFLGYKIADWRLRVFLHWIWQSERFSGATNWAVERNPDVLERQFFQRSGITAYRSSLTDYVKGLDTFLRDHRNELT